MRKIKTLLTIFATLISVIPVPVLSADFLPQRYTAVAFSSEGMWWHTAQGEDNVEASDRALDKCLEVAKGCLRGIAVEGDVIFASLTCPSHDKTIIARTRDGRLAIDPEVVKVLSERELFTECEVFTENFGGTLEQWAQVEDPFYFD